MKLQTTDPMERIIETALIRANIEYHIDGTTLNKTGLDFFLPNQGIYIEVKQFHTDRTAKQMEREPNIIVAQGIGAVNALAYLIEEANR